MDGTKRTADRAAPGVEATLRAVFEGIAELRELAAGVHARARAAGRAPTTDDLAAIRPTVLRQLDADDGLRAGTGVIAAPGVLGDAPRWLEWWRRPARGAELCPLCVDLDPDSVGAYEYPAAEWFEIPRSSGRRAVVGPYVDYAGTDEYILTFAAPVTGDAGFFGVAAADIRATDVERAVLPLLDSADGAPVLLVNASGRVIASNTPDAIAGSLAPADRSSGTRLPRGPGWEDCAGLPWTLLHPDAGPSPGTAPCRAP